MHAPCPPPPHLQTGSFTSTVTLPLVPVDARSRSRGGPLSPPALPSDRWVPAAKGASRRGSVAEAHLFALAFEAFVAQGPAATRPARAPSPVPKPSRRSKARGSHPTRAAAAAAAEAFAAAEVGAGVRAPLPRRAPPSVLKFVFAVSSPHASPLPLSPFPRPCTDCGACGRPAGC
jgi:hypothetical protein